MADQETRLLRVWRGDARHLTTVLPDSYRGQVALVVLPVFQ